MPADVSGEPGARGLGHPELVTSIPGLILRELVATDVDEYAALARRNVAHLGQFNDEQDAQSVAEAWDHDFTAGEADDIVRYGIRHCDRLVGRVDLLPAQPPRYGISYWLDEPATGHGFATVACASVIEYARVALSATDIYAGVAHHNHKSVAVLHRLEFRAVAELDTHIRFHRRLVPVAG